MRRKHKRVAYYATFAFVTVVVCGAGSWFILRDREVVVDDFVPGITNVHLRSAPATAPKMQFVGEELAFRHFPGQRTHRLPEDMGSGVALEDLDGDGDLDLFFVNNGPGDAAPPRCVALRNDGKGQFEPVEGDWPALYGNGVAAADFDADGDVDLFVTGYGKNVLLRNDGNFRFVDVTEQWGVADDASSTGGSSTRGFSTGACWGDADGDGDLDLYVGRYVEFDESSATATSQRGSTALPASLNPSTFPAQSNLLFLQEGDHFREASEESGVANSEGKSLAAMFVDFDGDGKLDLYVANDVTDNVMYRALGGGKFEDASHQSGTADWRGAMGLAVGDPDSDGDLDLFITHWKPEENALYVQDRAYFFRDDSMRTYLGPPGRGLIGWACDFADFDADGRPDLYVINGSTFEVPTATTQLEPMPAQLFWNGGQRFYDLAAQSGDVWSQQFVGRGGTVGDVDGDGDLDLIVVRHGKNAMLLRNETEGATRTLDIRVLGSAPNVLAYGATVIVEVNGRQQMQTVGAKVSYLSSGPHRLSFGLGKSKRADRVVVRFLSGRVVERRSVSPGRPAIFKEVDARSLGSKMDVARDALETGHLDVARDELRSVLTLDPRHRAALYLLAQLVPTHEALNLCDRLVRIEPQVPRGHLLRAKLLSNPLAPEDMNLEKARLLVARARELNRDETGGAFDDGRILLLQGKLAEAADVLEHVSANPDAAALAALCRFRLGQADRARTLLGVKLRAAPKGVAEEGDTAAKSMHDRTELARLLTLSSDSSWTRSESNSTVAAAERATTLAALQAATRFALETPTKVDAVPTGWGPIVEADVNGDGKLDRIVASPSHTLLPLPWWVFLRDGDGYRPVRGWRPHPAYRVTSITVSDPDDGGRVRLLIASGDGEPAWIVQPSSSDS